MRILFICLDCRAIRRRGRRGLPRCATGERLAAVGGVRSGGTGQEVEAAGRQRAPQPLTDDDQLCVLHDLDQGVMSRRDMNAQFCNTDVWVCTWKCGVSLENVSTPLATLS